MDKKEELDQRFNALPRKDRSYGGVVLRWQAVENAIAGRREQFNAALETFESWWPLGVNIDPRSQGPRLVIAENRRIPQQLGIAGDKQGNWEDFYRARVGEAKQRSTFHTFPTKAELIQLNALMQDYGLGIQSGYGIFIQEALQPSNVAYVQAKGGRRILEGSPMTFTPDKRGIIYTLRVPLDASWLVPGEY